MCKHSISNLWEFRKHNTKRDIYSNQCLHKKENQIKNNPSESTRIIGTNQTQLLKENKQ